MKPNEVLLMLLSSFFVGFTVGINNKATKKNQKFIHFASDVLMHGVSGAIMGALSTLYFDDLLIVCAIAAIGGMFGQQLIRAVGNRILKKQFPTDTNDEDCL
jgi:uncharacterized membrane protein